MKVNPLRYVLLAVLFVCTVAFQTTVSKTIWYEAQHAGGSVIPWLAILLNLHLIRPVACLLLGFFVASVRIWDPEAWLLVAVLVGFSLVVDGSDRRDPVMQWHTALKHLALVYRSAVFYAWFLCMLLFAIYFPERAAWDRRHPRLKWALLVPALATYALVVFERICANEGPAAQAFVQPARHITDIVRPVLLYSCLGLSLALLLVRLSSARDPDDRRRLRVLFFGLAISFVPAVIFEGLLERVLGMKFSPWVKLLA